ncbi:MAG: hypothetical protein KGH54_00070 [Candidatus Micrarchaeota archaeon]|nr:hypothetical protein [Candidatus Micrarchaeota archaeon]
MDQLSFASKQIATIQTNQKENSVQVFDISCSKSLYSTKSDFLTETPVFTNNSYFGTSLGRAFTPDISIAGCVYRVEIRTEDKGKTLMRNLGYLSVLSIEYLNTNLIKGRVVLEEGYQLEPKEVKRDPEMRISGLGIRLKDLIILNEKLVRFNQAQAGDVLFLLRDPVKRCVNIPN